MNVILADTNVFLRFILNDNPTQHQIAKNLIKKAKEGRINLTVPQIIIFEISFTLKTFYKFDKKMILEAISPIVSAKYLQVESRELFQKAIEIHKQQNLSLVDCFLIAKAEAENAQIFTFDKNLRKLGY